MTHNLYFTTKTPKGTPQRRTTFCLSDPGLKIDPAIAGLQWRTHSHSAFPCSSLTPYLMSSPSKSLEQKSPSRLCVQRTAVKASGSSIISQSTIPHQVLTVPGTVRRQEQGTVTCRQEAQGLILLCTRHQASCPTSPSLSFPFRMLATPLSPLDEPVPKHLGNHKVLLVYWQLFSQCQQNPEHADILSLTLRES